MEKQDVERHVRTFHEKIKDLHCHLCDFKTGMHASFKHHVFKVQIGEWVPEEKVESKLISITGLRCYPHGMQQARLRLHHPEPV